MNSQHVCDTLDELSINVLSALMTHGRPLTLQYLIPVLHGRLGRYVQPNEIAACLEGPLAPLVRPDATGRRWSLRQPALNTVGGITQAAATACAPSNATPAKAPRAESKLLPWQTAALSSWEKHRRKGIVEAVTGTGKTYVGLGAIKRLYAEDKRLSALVVVPTIPIMNQWCDKLATWFPGERVGRIGGGHCDDFSRLPIACVAVINSAIKDIDALMGHCRRGSSKSFLVADECHHYIDAPVFSRIRQFPFDYTLGLSATIQPYAVEGLGSIICEYKFPEAHRDGLIPAFSLLNVGVDLTTSEHRDYFALSGQIGRHLEQIKDLYADDLCSVPDHLFFRRLKQIMLRDHDPIISRFFACCFKRAAICYTAHAKLKLAESIIRHLVEDRGKKLLVFFERIESADGAQEDVELETVRRLHTDITKHSTFWCEVYHSGIDNRDRAAILSSFQKQGPSALLACRGLDEGIDIPSVDAALLVASTQSQRQRIQRIGRTLRQGSGGKKPIIATLFVKGTGDANVCVDDQQDFKGVAKVYQESEKNCMSRMKSLS